MANHGFLPIQYPQEILSSHQQHDQAMKHIHEPHHFHHVRSSPWHKL
uniref:Uncharacterized protein n=1 Tax=Arundo donax TaxID=35708 RepID=A0A0A9E379_ARUDO